jgi:hypothetical protein
LADTEGCIRACNSELIKCALDYANKIRLSIKDLLNVTLITDQGDIDPLKIVIAIKGLTGPEIWKNLEQRFKINIEKTTEMLATITVH